MRDQTDDGDETAPDDAAVDVRAVSKEFGDRSAVTGIDMCVAAGTVYGLLGRNGAGKTTLLRMILGLIAPDSGWVRIFGRLAPAGDVASRQAVGGFVEEPRFYPYLSAQRNLELLARLDGPAAVVAPRDALDLVDLAERGRDKVGTFSTGMRQRLGLAAALLRAPRLLVLDEPTIGLDPAHALAVRELLRSLAEDGVAVLLSSHNMAEVAELCDQVQIIHRGQTVWRGTQAALEVAAPAPVYRLWTSDDGRAGAVASRLGIRAESAVHGAIEHPLMVHADDRERDALVLELAGEGVAVRRLEPDVPPLELLFTSLTADGDGGEVAA